MSVTQVIQSRRFPEPAATLRLIKPITWFPPMWAYVCGVISSGASPVGQWWLVLLGVLLAGPIVCGMSQAANDWCDRHVDAINEPDRPIPSGRIPGRWGLWIALAMSALSLFARTGRTRARSSGMTRLVARHSWRVWFRRSATRKRRNRRQRKLSPSRRPDLRAAS